MGESRGVLFFVPMSDYEGCLFFSSQLSSQANTFLYVVVSFFFENNHFVDFLCFLVLFVHKDDIFEDSPPPYAPVIKLP